MNKKQKINIYRTILTCTNGSLDQKNVLMQREEPKPSVIGIKAPWSTKLNVLRNQNSQRNGQMNQERVKIKTNYNKQQFQIRQDYVNSSQTRKQSQNIFKTFADKPLIQSYSYSSQLKQSSEKLKGLPLKLGKLTSNRKNQKQQAIQQSNISQSNYSVTQNDQIINQPNLEGISFIESVIDTQAERPEIQIQKTKKQGNLFEVLNQTSSSTDFMINNVQTKNIQQFLGYIKTPQRLKFAQLNEKSHMSKSRDQFKIIDKLFFQQKAKSDNNNKKYQILNEGIRLFSNESHKQLYLGNYSKIINQLDNDQTQMQQIRQHSEVQNNSHYQLLEVEQQVSVILNFNDDSESLKQQKLIQIIKEQQGWINPQTIQINDQIINDQIINEQTNFQLFIPKLQAQTNKVNKNDGKKIFMIIQKLQRNLQRLINDKQSQNQFIPDNNENKLSQSDIILVGLVKLYNYLMEPEQDYIDNNTQLFTIPIDFQQFKAVQIKTQLKCKIKQITESCIMSLNKQLIIDINSINSTMIMFRHKFHHSLERVSWIQWVRVLLELYQRVEMELS